MDIKSQAELTAFIIMAIIVFLKTYGFYLLKKRQKPDLEFDPVYAITGLFGLFLAYSAYQVQTDDPFEIFKSAAVYAIGYNLLLDQPRKFFGKPEEKDEKTV